MVFAQGFVHAQERLWQMDFTRRVVFGRLSEVLGETALPVDRVMRTLGLFRTAEQEAEKVSGELRSLLDAYCAGIGNTWIEIAMDRKNFRSNSCSWDTNQNLGKSRIHLDGGN